MSAERAELARTSLARLAELRGDATSEVLERYYVAQPGARASFEAHGLGDVAQLEARMVSETLFLLLRWAEDPASARIDQATTVVHHNDTLEIGPAWYMGLVDAALSVLLETVPDDGLDERAMWQAIRGEIARFIDSLRCEFWRTIDPRPLVDT